MGVSKPADKPAEEVVAEKVPEIVTVQIELLAYNRFVLEGQLYEIDRIYEVEESHAKQLLRLRADDGRPAFARFDPEAVRPGDEEIARTTKPVVVAKPKVEAPVPTTDASDSKPKAIEIGDDAELAAEGLIGKDAGEATEL